jgi:hypothetical protein
MKKEPIKISLSMRIKPSTIQCQYRSSNSIVVLLIFIQCIESVSANPNFQGLEKWSPC